MSVRTFLWKSERPDCGDLEAFRVGNSTSYVFLTLSLYVGSGRHAVWRDDYGDSSTTQFVEV